MRDELVMVVPREVLFAGGRAFQGFTPDAGPFLRTAMSDYLFVPRRRAERDDRYKQIIPYVVIRATPAPGRAPLYLMFQRAAGGDPRLRRQYSLGLGGHVNADDVLAAPLVWGVGEAQRQLVAAGNGAAPPGRPSTRKGGGGGPSGAGQAPPPPQRPLPSGRPPWSWPRAGLPARIPGRAAGAAGRPGTGVAAAQGPVGGTPGPARVLRRLRLDPDLRRVLEPRMRARAHEHPLFRGLRRELREEISFPRGATLSLLGAINDDSDSVGRVHFGLAFVLAVPPRRPAPRAVRPGASRRGRPVVSVDLLRRGARIRLRHEPGGSVQVGSLFGLEQVRAYAQAMESWSLVLLDSGALHAGCAR